MVDMAFTNEKYVAFMDILGFKKYVYSHTQEEVREYILKFCSVVYDVWQEKHLSEKVILNQADNEGRLRLEALLVSDSLVLHTEDSSLESLRSLLSFIVAVCKKSFEKKILFRCGIAHGEYDELTMYSPEGLSKNPLYGLAYIDAYQLESSSKSSAIIFNEKVKNDILSYKIYEEVDFFEEKQGKKTNYILSWADETFFNNESNLASYCKMAKNAEWLPHYYNTVWYALRQDGNKARNIFSKMRDYYLNGTQKQWVNIGMFMKNSTADGVNKDCMYVIQSLISSPLTTYDEKTQSLYFH